MDYIGAHRVPNRSGKLSKGRQSIFELAVQYYQKPLWFVIFFLFPKPGTTALLPPDTGKMKNQRYMHRMLDVVGARDILRTL